MWIYFYIDFKYHQFTLISSHEIHDKLRHSWKGTNPFIRTTDIILGRMDCKNYEMFLLFFSYYIRLKILQRNFLNTCKLIYSFEFCKNGLMYFQRFLWNSLLNEIRNNPENEIEIDRLNAPESLSFEAFKISAIQWGNICTCNRIQTESLVEY